MKLSPSLLALQPAHVRAVLSATAPPAKRTRRPAARTAPVAAAAATVERRGDGVVITIPGVRLASEANERGKWAKGAKRAASLRAVITALLRNVERPAGPRWLVIIERVGARLLDDDNLAGACKSTRDAVAAWGWPKVTKGGRVVGDDGPKAPVRWSCAQSVGPWAVRITVSGDAAESAAAKAIGGNLRGGGA